MTLTPERLEYLEATMRLRRIVDSADAETILALLGMLAEKDGVIQMLHAINVQDSKNIDLEIGATCVHTQHRSATFLTMKEENNEFHLEFRGNARTEDRVAAGQRR